MLDASQNQYIHIHIRAGISAAHGKLISTAYEGLWWVFDGGLHFSSWGLVSASMESTTSNVPPRALPGSRWAACIIRLLKTCAAPYEKLKH
jgi:hypothetical protein